MARRRDGNSTEEPVVENVENLTNETLSQETPEVQKEVLKDLFGEITVTDSEPTTVDMSKEELPKEVQNMHVEVENAHKEDKDDGLKVGDRVKIKKNVGNDIVGRRIHNGIKNYLYTVKHVRSDGYVTIECLTYTFTLHNKDLEFIKRR
jgi:hypothetical protein